MILDDIQTLIEVVHPNFTKGFAESIRNSIKALNPNKTTRLLTNTKTRIPSLTQITARRARYL